MLFIKKKKVVSEKKSFKKRTQRKKKKDYLLEDPSIRKEVHSLWEAEDIYDEDDFCDK